MTQVHACRRRARCHTIALGSLFRLYSRYGRLLFQRHFLALNYMGCWGWSSLRALHALLVMLLLSTLSARGGLSFTTCPWCFFGDLAAILFVGARCSCYMVHGYLLFHPILLDLDVLWDHRVDAIESRSSWQELCVFFRGEKPRWRGQLWRLFNKHTVAGCKGGLEPYTLVVIRLARFLCSPEANISQFSEQRSPVQKLQTLRRCKIGIQCAYHCWWAYCGRSGRPSVEKGTEGRPFRLSVNSRVVWIRLRKHKYIPVF